MGDIFSKALTEASRVAKHPWQFGQQGKIEPGRRQHAEDEYPKKPEPAKEKPTRPPDLPAGTKTRRMKMVRPKSACHDGIHMFDYQAGGGYDLPLNLADGWLASGDAAPAEKPGRERPRGFKEK